MLDRGKDLDFVSHQFDEPFDPAASGPGDPVLERVDGLVVGQLEHEPEAFLEESGAVQPGFDLRDPRQLRLLSGGEVLGVLPTVSPSRLERNRWSGSSSR